MGLGPEKTGCGNKVVLLVRIFVAGRGVVTAPFSFGGSEQRIDKRCSRRASQQDQNPHTKQRQQQRNEPELFVVPEEVEELAYEPRLFFLACSFERLRFFLAHRWA